MPEVDVRDAASVVFGDRSFGFSTPYVPDSILASNIASCSAAIEAPPAGFIGVEGLLGNDSGVEKSRGNGSVVGKSCEDDLGTEESREDETDSPSLDEEGTWVGKMGKRLDICKGRGAVCSVVSLRIVMGVVILGGLVFPFPKRSVSFKTPPDQTGDATPLLAGALRNGWTS